MNLQVDPQILLLGFLLAISVLGIPHGALDFFIAKRMMRPPSLKKQAGFLLGYLLITLMSIIFWVYFPAVALAIFLAMSAYHFSTDWQRQLPKVSAMAMACIVLFAPSLHSADAIRSIFSVLLLSDEPIGLLLKVMQIFAVLGFVILFLNAKAIVELSKDNHWSGIEIVALLVSAMILPPLLHFTLYFCLLHSLKHWKEVALQTQLNHSKLIVIAIPICLATFAGAALMFGLFIKQPFEEGVLQLVFIGLFGLTVAHMLLIDQWYSRRAIPSGGH